MKLTHPKLFLSEICLALVAFLLFVGTAFAQPINDPRAEIFRIHGCEAEWLQPVIGKDGETILYWQNTDGRGCKADRGGPTVVEEEEEEEEVVETPTDPETPIKPDYPVEYVASR